MTVSRSRSNSNASTGASAVKLFDKHRRPVGFLNASLLEIDGDVFSVLAAGGETFLGGLDFDAKVADILIDLAQRETKTFSVQFARGLIESMRTATRMHKNALKSAGFRVLRAPDIPSVLVELGYVSNKEDLKSLLSDAWRVKTADAVAQAIETYFTTHMAGAHAGTN